MCISAFLKQTQGPPYAPVVNWCPRVNQWTSGESVTTWACALCFLGVQTGVDLLLKTLASWGCTGGNKSCIWIILYSQVKSFIKVPTRWCLRSWEQRRFLSPTLCPAPGFWIASSYRVLKQRILLQLNRATFLWLCVCRVGIQRSGFPWNVVYLLRFPSICSFMLSVRAGRPVHDLKVFEL